MRFASNMCNFCNSFCCYCTCYFSSFSFHHIPIFFWEKRCPACNEDCPVAVKKCRNRECDYTFEKKKKDWERVKKRGVISLTHEREKVEYRVGIYVVEIH